MGHSAVFFLLASLFVFVAPPARAALLNVQVATSHEAVNLTEEGQADWVHWGLYTETSLNRKYGVSPQISNFSILGHQWPPAYQYSDETVPFPGYSWSDGTPQRSVTNTMTGVYVVGQRNSDNGFQITVPADTETKTLRVYCGVYGAQGSLRALLSDGSAPAYTDTSLDYAVGSMRGVYTIEFAAASPNQTLFVNFTVTSMYSGYGNVTLQAATLVTPNLPPGVTLLAPTNQAVFTAPANILLAADATNADGAISAVYFYEGTNQLGVCTAPPYSVAWSNVPAGVYDVTAVATDGAGIRRTSRVATVFVTAGGGSLSGSFATPAGTVNLTAEGRQDWGHWGLGGLVFNHKQIEPRQINDLTVIGNNPSEAYAGNPISFSWSDGTPAISVASTATGYLVYGLTNGFQLTVPADQVLRKIKIYVGLYGARAQLSAQLSDCSALPYTDTSFESVYGSPVRVYTLVYRAASAGQSLTVRYTTLRLYDPFYGNTTFQAATVGELHSPNLLNPHWQGDTFLFSFPTRLDLRYTVESKTSILSSWQSFTNFTGTGTEALITDPVPASPNNFYRVLVE